MMLRKKSGKIGRSENEKNGRRKKNESEKNESEKSGRIHYY